MTVIAMLGLTVEEVLYLDAMLWDWHQQYDSLVATDTPSYTLKRKLDHAIVNGPLAQKMQGTGLPYGVIWEKLEAE